MHLLLIAGHVQDCSREIRKASRTQRGQNTRTLRVQIIKKGD